jgi:hypothetical protein
MSVVPNQNAGSPLSLVGDDGWPLESPKFDIIPATTLAPGMRLVALNEAAAKKLFEYVNECGGDDGDAWLVALINRLKASFTDEAPKMPARRFGRHPRGS